MAQYGSSDHVITFCVYEWWHSQL